MQIEISQDSSVQELVDAVRHLVSQLTNEQRDALCSAADVQIAKKQASLQAVEKIVFRESYGRRVAKVHTIGMIIGNFLMKKVVEEVESFEADEEIENFTPWDSPEISISR